MISSLFLKKVKISGEHKYLHLVYNTLAKAGRSPAGRLLGHGVKD
jgi:hypothetical protein